VLSTALTWHAPQNKFLQLSCVWLYMEDFSSQQYPSHSIGELSEKSSRDGGMCTIYEAVCNNDGMYYTINHESIITLENLLINNPCQFQDSWYTFLWYNCSLSSGMQTRIANTWL